MSVFVIILVFFGVGVLANRFIDIPEKLPSTLNQSVIYIAYPAAVLLSVGGASWTKGAMFPVVIYWIGAVLLWFACVICSKLFNWSKAIQISVFLLTACGNTAFMGYPMVSAFFSQDALQYALLYDQLGSFLAVSIIGPLAIALITTDEQKPNPLKLVKNVLLFPPFTALVLGLSLPLDNLVAFARPVLELLSVLIIPLTMIAIGIQFKFAIANHHRLPLICALSLKMLLLPLFVYAAAVIFSVPNLIANVSVFESAMPPMVTAAALLLANRVETTLVISILGIGTLVSFITLPLLSELLLI